MSKVYTEASFDTSIFDKFEKDMQDVLSAELESFGMDVERDAKVLAPKDLGKLAQLIKSQMISKTTVEISSGAAYAAYVEFGTGRFAASYLAGMPPELQEYAMQFFVTGKGHLPARPHLMPAFYKNRKLLIERLKTYFER